MPIPYQFYLEVHNLSLNGWSPITLRLRLWHIKEVCGSVSNLSGIQTVLMPVISGRPNLSAFCSPAPQSTADKEPPHTFPHPHHRYRRCPTSESGESQVSPSLLSISVVLLSCHVSLNVNTIFYVWVSLNGNLFGCLNRYMKLRIVREISKVNFPFNWLIYNWIFLTEFSKFAHIKFFD